jgi:rhombotail lipoprotein
MRRFGIALAAAAAAVLAAGCSWSEFYGGGRVRDGQSSSVVEFLYPKGEIPPPADDVVPTLNIPLRAGIAFVPSRVGSPEVLTEPVKAELLERVRQDFLKEPFIREIEVIPDAYLRGGQGFETLEQVGRLYDLDVMALVSYDQVAISEDRKSSLLYWTIVGAYVVEGTRNEVQTFVDTAVFDLPTRKLLLRAPGSDRVVRSDTLVESAQKLREAQQASYGRAVDAMIGNLRTELTAFEARIKDEGVAKVAQRDGGGGAMGVGVLLALAGLGVWGYRASSRRASRTTPGCTPPAPSPVTTSVGVFTRPTSDSGGRAR